MLPNSGGGFSMSMLTIMGLCNKRYIIQYFMSGEIDYSICMFKILTNGQIVNDN